LKHKNQMTGKVHTVTKGRVFSVDLATLRKIQADILA